MSAYARARRLAPLLLAGGAVAFNLVALHAEARFATPVNDAGLHLEMVRWADGQIDAGRVPLDGWFPNFQLGSPQFHHYQSAPHILTAYASRIFGLQRTYNWTLYLLLSLWPLCIYATTRLFGGKPWTAALAAAASPLVHSVPGYGFEYESYTWNGLGLWSQLWAMWTLPLAWALSWRAVCKRGPIVLGALATAATVAFHLIAGYLAFVMLPVWVIASRVGRLRDRALRAAGVAAGAFLIASWVLVPLITDGQWHAQSSFNRDTFFGDSFGAKRVLGWLFSGKLFDRGRFPVVTLLVFAGIIRCFRRRRTDPAARALLYAWFACLLLFFGRPTLGPLLNLLPGIRDVILHRFIMGVHLTGILLAGAGAFALARPLKRLAGIVARDARAVATGVAILALALSFPAWRERWSAARHDAALITAQRAADAGGDMADVMTLIDRAKAEGAGRIYAGLRSSWGASYRVGFTPVYSILAQNRADAIGFTFRTAALSVDVEAYFDESNPAHYQLMNVRYLLMPQERQPPVPATMLDHRGHHVLWRVQTGGYLRVIDTAGPVVETDRAHIIPDMLAFIGTRDAGVHPPVRFAGIQPTITAETTPQEPAGFVDSQLAFPDDGAFGGRATLQRPGIVALSASFDGRWTATVDGRPAPIQFVAPSLVGVPVDAGTHSILLEYSPHGGYPWLFAIGVLAALGMWLGPRAPRRRGASGVKPLESDAVAASPSSSQRRSGPAWPIGD